MSVGPQPAEFAQATEQIGEHLLREAIHNPLLAHPKVQFWAAALASEYTGSPEATELAWQNLRNHPSELQVAHVENFAESLLAAGTSEAITDAYAVTKYMPTEGEEQRARANVLTQIVETSTDEDFKQHVADETAEELLHVLAEKGERAFYFPSPAELLLRIGLATSNLQRVFAATAAIGPHGRYELEEIACKAFANESLDPGIRAVLIDAIVGKQEKYTSQPYGAAVGSGLAEHLTKDELTRLVRAIKGTNRHFVDFSNDIDDGPSTIFVPNVRGGGEGLAMFNDLVTKLDAWNSTTERLRFHVHALRAKHALPVIDKMSVLRFISKRLSKTEERNFPGYGYVDGMLSRISGTLASSSLPADSDRLDKVLTNFGVFIDKTDTDTKRLSYVVTSDWNRLTKQVEEGHFKEADLTTVSKLHQLRDILPTSSQARVEFNLALLKSGDVSALDDLVQSLSGDTPSENSSGNTAEQLHKFVFNRYLTLRAIQEAI